MAAAVASPAAKATPDDAEVEAAVWAWLDALFPSVSQHVKARRVLNRPNLEAERQFIVDTMPDNEMKRRGFTDRQALVDALAETLVVPRSGETRTVRDCIDTSVYRAAMTNHTTMAVEQIILFIYRTTGFSCGRADQLYTLADTLANHPPKPNHLWEPYGMLAPDDFPVTLEQRQRLETVEQKWQAQLGIMQGEQIAYAKAAAAAAAPTQHPRHRLLQLAAARPRATSWDDMFERMKRYSSADDTAALQVLHDAYKHNGAAIFSALTTLHDGGYKKLHELFKGDDAYATIGTLVTIYFALDVGIVTTKPIAYDSSPLEFDLTALFAGYLTNLVDESSRDLWAVIRNGCRTLQHLVHSHSAFSEIAYAMANSDNINLLHVIAEKTLDLYNINAQVRDSFVRQAVDELNIISAIFRLHPRLPDFDQLDAISIESDDWEPNAVFVAPDNSVTAYVSALTALAPQITAADFTAISQGGQQRKEFIDGLVAFKSTAPLKMFAFAYISRVLEFSDTEFVDVIKNGVKHRSSKRAELIRRLNARPEDPTQAAAYAKAQADADAARRAQEEADARLEKERDTERHKELVKDAERAEAARAAAAARAEQLRKQFAAVQLGTIAEAKGKPNTIIGALHLISTQAVYVQLDKDVLTKWFAFISMVMQNPTAKNDFGAITYESADEGKTYDLRHSAVSNWEAIQEFADQMVSEIKEDKSMSPDDVFGLAFEAFLVLAAAQTYLTPIASKAAVQAISSIAKLSHVLISDEKVAAKLQGPANNEKVVAFDHAMHMIRKYYDRMAGKDDPEEWLKDIDLTRDHYTLLIDADNTLFDVHAAFVPGEGPIQLQQLLIRVKEARVKSAQDKHSTIPGAAGFRASLASSAAATQTLHKQPTVKRYNAAQQPVFQIPSSDVMNARLPVVQVAAPAAAQAQSNAQMYPSIKPPASVGDQKQVPAQAAAAITDTERKQAEKAIKVLQFMKPRTNKSDNEVIDANANTLNTTSPTIYYPGDTQVDLNGILKQLDKLSHSKRPSAVASVTFDTNAKSTTPFLIALEEAKANLVEVINKNYSTPGAKRRTVDIEAQRLCVFIKNALKENPAEQLRVLGSARMAILFLIPKNNLQDPQSEFYKKMLRSLRDEVGLAPMDFARDVYVAMQGENYKVVSKAYDDLVNSKPVNVRKLRGVGKRRGRGRGQGVKQGGQAVQPQNKNKRRQRKRKGDKAANRPQ